MNTTFYFPVNESGIMETKFKVTKHEEEFMVHVSFDKNTKNVKLENPGEWLIMSRMDSSIISGEALDEGKYLSSIVVRIPRTYIDIEIGYESTEDVVSIEIV